MSSVNKKNNRKKKTFKNKEFVYHKEICWLKKKDYTSFLNSEYWKFVKSKVLKRDNYKCIICETTKNLQVHHTTYKNHFNEHCHLEDLHTLCEFHHHEVHTIMEVN